MVTDSISFDYCWYEYPEIASGQYELRDGVWWHVDLRRSLSRRDDSIQATIAELITLSADLENAKFAMISEVGYPHHGLSPHVVGDHVVTPKELVFLNKALEMRDKKYNEAKLNSVRSLQERFPELVVGEQI